MAQFSGKTNSNGAVSTQADDVNPSEDVVGEHALERLFAWGGGTELNTRIELIPRDLLALEGEQLLAPFNPFDQSSHDELIVRDVRNFYSVTLLRHVHRKVVACCVNRTVLAFQSAALGVGGSTFLRDYSTSYNYAAERLGHYYRMVYYQVPPDSHSAAKFLQDLASLVNAPISPSEFKILSRMTLMHRIVAAAWAMGVAVIVIDHVDELSESVRRLLDYFLSVVDPATHVPRQFGKRPTKPPRVGIILSSTKPPEKLYKECPELLIKIGGRQALLAPYTNVTQVAEALRTAGIGMDGFTLGNTDADTVAQFILEATDGLVCEMARLFEWADALARLNKKKAPQLVEFHQAVRVHKRLVRLWVGSARVANEPPRKVYATRAVPLSVTGRLELANKSREASPPAAQEEVGDEDKGREEPDAPKEKTPRVLEIQKRKDGRERAKKAVNQRAPRR